MKIKIEIRVYRKRNNSKGYGVGNYDIKEYFFAISSPQVPESNYIFLACCCSEDIEKGMNFIYCDANLCSFESADCIDFPNDNNYCEELVIKDGENRQKIIDLTDQLFKEYEGKDKKAEIASNLLNMYIFS